MTSFNPFTDQYRRGYVDFEQFPSVMKFLNQSDYQDLALLINAEGNCRDLDDEKLREVIMILTFKSLSAVHRELFVRSLATYICSRGFTNDMSHLEKFRKILQSDWSEAKDFTCKFERVLTKLPAELLQQANKILKTALKPTKDSKWFGDEPGVYPIPERAPKEDQSQSQGSVDVKMELEHEGTALNKIQPTIQSNVDGDIPAAEQQPTDSEPESGSGNDEGEGSENDQDNGYDEGKLSDS